MELSAHTLKLASATPKARPPSSPFAKEEWPELTALTPKAAVSTQAKWSYVTRNVPAEDVVCVSPHKGYQPEPGDLVLVKVQKIAQHTRVQLKNGRRSQLFVGDQLVVAYGNRYAPDQFEAEVPVDLDACHLVAAGGIAARALSKNSKLKWPTAVQPEGLLVNATGQVMNLRDYVVLSDRSAELKPVICVAGTSMNAGKTTVMASLVKGLSAAGLAVAALKVTGTGAGNDMWAYTDAGADLTLDFTDRGHASTYKLSGHAIEACLKDLVHQASAEAHIDVILVEIADGLLHHETLALMQSQTYRDLNPKLVFAAGEAMGAMAGHNLLRAKNIAVRAVSGVLSASELALKEASVATGLPVWTKEALQSPAIAKELL